MPEPPETLWLLQNINFPLGICIASLWLLTIDPKVLVSSSVPPEDPSDTQYELLVFINALLPLDSMCPANLGIKCCSPSASLVVPESVPSDFHISPPPFSTEKTTPFPTTAK